MALLSLRKMKLFQTKIRLLGHDIYQGIITFINRSIKFVDKFPNEIKDKKQFQKVLGCLNYVSSFIPDFNHISTSLFQRF